MLTTVSRGETPSLDLEVGKDRVSIPSPFPLSFGDDIESSPLDGVPMRTLVSEVFELRGVCPMEDLDETPGSRMGLMAAFPKAFLLGPRHGPETQDDGEVLGGASPSFGYARDEAVSSMARQLRNFLSGVS